ncbi:LEAF RUST 10 DISEASE-RESISTANCEUS RECEPTOR-LIKE PROTEIN KINASE-like 2.1 [Miscanthus floridulus]|uniref:LEAF RUST 10 DISEASE-RESISTANCEUS RECEPTOR-LIKE PROTEIN KINASE-like 2.1 n=1 Tax=Miscanthus floridulus TaxID=154761 RepID=UPI003457775C
MAPRQLLLALATLLAVCSSASADPRMSVAGQTCALGVAVSGSALANNFVPAMEDLYMIVIRGLIVIGQGFGLSAVGSEPSTVFGLGQCFRDLSPVDCKLCFGQVRSLLPKCYPRVGGRVYLDGCFGRYGNYSFFGEDLDASEDAIVCGTTTAEGNYTVADPRAFRDAVGAALANVTAAAGSEGFGTGSAASASATAFALAQCWVRGGSTACAQCLRAASAAVMNCAPAPNGRALFTGCYLRYSTRPFWNNVNATTGSSSGHKKGSETWHKKGSKTYIIASTLSILLVSLFILALFLARKYGLLSNKPKEEQMIKSFLQKNGNLRTIRYTYAEVKRMSMSFSIKLGQGGFGDVYRGNLSDSRQVAVKLLKDSKGDGEEFMNEVASISKTSHVNVVMLLGFCLEGSKRALVYEYMPNGSLERYAFNRNMNNQNLLNWEKLFDIAVGIARGLEYLHRGCNTRIVHFDIKPHNILLDHDFCPKISDFGLAKLCPNKESAISIAGARGTIGYIAPEVYSKQFGIVSSKSDVYSYGMMVLEMVGARDKNINNADSECSSQYFPQWIYEHLDDYCISISKINGETTEFMRKMIIVGLWCIQVAPTYRPTMTRVVEMLEQSTSNLELPPKVILTW